MPTPPSQKVHLTEKSGSSVRHDISATATPISVPPNSLRQRGSRHGSTWNDLLNPIEPAPATIFGNISFDYSSVKLTALGYLSETRGAPAVPIVRPIKCTDDLDRPTCKSCGAQMWASRITPIGGDKEIVKFECPVCEVSTARQYNWSAATVAPVKY